MPGLGRADIMNAGSRESGYRGSVERELPTGRGAGKEDHLTLVVPLKRTICEAG
ncbi:unnamed protein product, partial [Staurois parvus]